MRLFQFITCLLAMCAVACTLAEPAYPTSSAYSLKINGASVPVIEFDAKYDYALCSANGACNVEITRLDGKPIVRHSITPLKLKIAGSVTNAIMSFTIAQPAYLIVEVDELRKLVIAVDPVETDKPASSGAGIFNVTDGAYGADPTGKTPSTSAIQRACDDAGKNAGTPGVVYVPGGVFNLSELQLPGNVSLYLESGAVLRCAGEKKDLKVRYHKKSQNRDGTWFIHTVPGATNVKIFGRGTIDGDGKRMEKSLNLTNHLVVPMNCTNFTMDGPTLRDSGLWGLVVANSRHVTLKNLKHFNHLDMGEDDCVDICNSQDVLVQRSIAISLDDPYSTKTWGPGTDLTVQWSGAMQGNRDIVLDDCVAWTRCFAFKIGAGVWMPQENITIRNGVVYDSAHAIGISHSYGSADVRNVTFDTIDVERNLMTNLGRSWARIVIDRRKPDGGEGGGVYDVRIGNINVRDAGTDGVMVNGLSESKKITGVTFENIVMPGQDAAAKTLKQIGVSESSFADGVTIRP